MTKELERLRDEMAREYSLDSVDTCHFVDFKAGFNALHSHLTDAAGEFDEQTALAFARTQFSIEQKSSDASYRELNIFLAAVIEGARWQFEQDRTRIGIALEVATNDRNARESHYKRIKELEAHVAESADKQLALALKYNAAADRVLAAEKEREGLRAALVDIKDTCEETGLSVYGPDLRIDIDKIHETIMKALAKAVTIKR